MTTMSATVMQRLQLRANQTDEIIAMLRKQLQGLQQAAGAANCKLEEEKLRMENAQLKGEVERLKERLVKAETRNGVKQYMPRARSVLSQATAVPPSETVGSVKPVVPATKQEPKKQEFNEKKQKEKKEAKPKQAPAAADNVVLDVSRLDMRIGVIVDVSKHPEADGLYVEKVDVGDGKIRTVVSGLVKHIPIEKMQNKVAVFLCNLKPSKLRGITSEAMIMCGSSPEIVEIINPPEGSVPGEKITFKDYPGMPDAVLNPKKKVWESIQPDLRIDANGVATYKGCPFEVPGRGICDVPTMRNTGIK